MNQQPPDRLLRSFERYLRATNRSERTVGNYLENLHQVEAFLQPPWRAPARRHPRRP